MHFRAQRSARMAFEDESITFQEILDYKMDTRMELADRIINDLLKLTANDNDEIIIEARRFYQTGIARQITIAREQYYSKHGQIQYSFMSIKMNFFV